MSADSSSQSFATRKLCQEASLGCGSAQFLTPPSSGELPRTSVGHGTSLLVQEGSLTGGVDLRTSWPSRSKGLQRKLCGTCSSHQSKGDPRSQHRLVDTWHGSRLAA